MKSVMFALIFLLAASVVWAQPDPRDSIILESKTVQLGTGQPYTTVKVYITNKDSLAWMTLALKELSTSGGTYGLLSRTASGLLTFSSVITTLTPTLNDFGVGNFGGYNGASPDTFLVAAGYSPGDLSTVEPPNATRKAVWEIKFDTVRGGAGTLELDSAVVLNHRGGYFSSWLAGIAEDVPVNFVKSVITAYPKGDFNFDLRMSAADIVTLLNCVFQSQPPPGGVSCDVNCDGQASGADVVTEVNAVFLQEPFPC
ncbi:MAG: hypothetical protein L0196_07535 [candidate division Zixibacteria bacterium]|nr:hypothetical protein [candidate division Zixibacteria bacterium]